MMLDDDSLDSSDIEAIDTLDLSDSFEDSIADSLIRSYEGIFFN